jgi:uncharacterized protein YggT (Ycf19 family)
VTETTPTTTPDVCLFVGLLKGVGLFLVAMLAFLFLTWFVGREKVTQNLVTVSGERNPAMT